jgi:predicted ATPase
LKVIRSAAGYNRRPARTSRFICAFIEAGLGAQAIPYWQRAGERALHRWANLEAISHLKQGLELLGSLPDAPERNRPADEAQRYSLLLPLGEA